MMWLQYWELLCGYSIGNYYGGENVRNLEF
jgi:hypothetical protein